MYTQSQKEKQYGSFINVLQKVSNKILEIKPNQENYEKFEEELLKMLQSINDIQKMGLESILNRLFGISFALGRFQPSQSQFSNKILSQAPQQISTFLDFQKTIYQFGIISESNFTDYQTQLIKQIKTRNSLIFEMSFNQKYAVQYLSADKIIQLLKHIKCDLTKPMKGNQFNLLQYLLTGYNGFTSSNADKLKEIINQHQINQQSYGLTNQKYGDLFSNCFKGKRLGSKIKILDDKRSFLFQVYKQNSKQKIEQLQFSASEQKQLQSAIFSDDNFEKNIKINNKSFEIECNKDEILIIFDNQTIKNIRCKFLPIQKKDVSWLILKEKNNQVIHLKQQISKQITDIIKSKQTVFNLITDSLQKFQLKINKKDLTLQNIDNPNQFFGYLIWIPSYKIKHDNKEQITTNQQTQIQTLYQNDMIVINQSPSIHKKQEKRFPGLACLKHYFPYQIDASTYEVNDTTLYCSNPQICQMFSKFEDQGIPNLISSRLGGEQMFSISITNIDKLKNLAKYIIFYSKAKNLPLLEAQYFQKNDKVVIKSFVDKDSEQFVKSFSKYLLNRQMNKKQKQLFDLDKDQIEIVKGLEKVTAINAVKKGDKMTVQSDPLTMQIIKKILINERIIQKIDLLQQLEHLQKQDRCYMKQISTKIKITKFPSPTFQIECQSKYLAQFLNKLYEAQKSLVQIQKLKQIVQIKQFHNMKFYPKFQKLQMHQNVKTQLLQKNKDNIATISIKFPKIIQKLINEQIQKIRKQIAFESITILNISNSSFEIQNIKDQIAIKISQALKFSLNKFKSSIRFDPQNTTQRELEPAVEIISKPNSSVFTLINGFESSIAKFQEDRKIIEKFIVAYKKQLQRLSVDRMDHFVNHIISFYLVSPQKTTQQKKANNIIRNLLIRQIKNIIQPLNEKKLIELDQEALQYLQNNFGTDFKPTAFQSFKKIFNSKSIIKVFNLLLENSLQQNSKNSQIQQSKIVQYKNQIKSFLKPIVDELQHLYERGQIIPIKKLVSFQRSIRICSDIFFKIDLPIVKHLNQFKQKIQSSRLMVVKTGTGSGKSTVLPPFILGLGYKKVYVTQPRRLPCKRICQRIATTNGNDVVGYRLGGGVAKNPQNDLIYITDGLLKQIIYKDDSFLKDVDVIILDEVHEQTKSIDLIILLLRKLMDKYKQLKVILCSATVNESLIGLFDPKLPRSTFQVSVNMHPVTEHEIKNTSILEKVKSLYKDLSANDQMLVFFPSVGQVQQYKKVFEQQYGIKAYGLYGEQKPQIQEEAMTKGRVIFSTSVSQTSLTFQGLKIVVDSQKSRIQTYDLKQKMIVSKQIKSSQSSIRQRRGRLGRTQPGDYYYMVYNDQIESSKYDLSQLDRSELVNVCFELLIKYQDWRLVQDELRALKVNDPVEFEQKLKLAKDTLCQFNDLIFRQGSYKVSQICKQEIFCYGNMGNIYYNISLYRSIIEQCFQNMVAVISFTMIGIPVFPIILNNFTGNRSTCSGDIEAAGRFILDISRKMKLDTIKSSQIYSAFRKLPEAKKYQSMGTLLVRVLVQMKKLFNSKMKYINGTQDWKIVNKIIAETFQNNLFFNRGMIGGNSKYFQKIIPNMIYHPNLPIQIANDVQFQLNKNSILYNKAQKVPFIVALGCVVNPFSSCTLSFCCKAQVETLKTKISLSLQQHTKTLGKLDIIDEAAIFGPLIGAKGMMNIQKNGKQIKIKGSFYQVLNQYSNINNHLRKNWVTDIRQWLLQKIVFRNQVPGKRTIKSSDVEANFQKLDFFKLFTPLTKQFKILYNVQIRWRNKGKVEINQASNFIMGIFQKKINGFLNWFVQTQIVNTEDLKQHPIQIAQNARNADGIKKRINQIVDPKVNFAILKSWVSGIYQNVPIRVYRMIAVSWILVNNYDCCIKGGFVRDWVVNGQHKIPGGPQTNMLIKDGNGIYRIRDQTITPSDIDVDLSPEKPFNFQQFKKLMNKLGIKTQMKDDGWRYLLAFDVNEPTGGFTADLIHPYCYVSHDKCDFDVNMMFIKGGHLNQIGLKIPLKLRQFGQGANSNEFQVKLQDLIKRCQDKKMRKIITLLDDLRIQKFQNRNWNIDVTLFQPVIHYSFKTSMHSLTEKELQKTDPNWYNVMVRKNGKIVLNSFLIKNHCFQTGYDSAKCWIANETKNLNQVILYHGASQKGAQGISQSGFDSRFYGQAYGQTFGRGAYFAQDPMYSDSYVNPNGNGERFMLICKVVLGNMQILNVTNNQKMGPAQGFHSVKATARLPNLQYIIDRWGQARPWIFIKYR